jgi:hypothetical protein
MFDLMSSILYMGILYLPKMLKYSGDNRLWNNKNLYGKAHFGKLGLQDRK